MSLFFKNTVFIISAAFLVKLLSFGAQLYLGHILSVESFGSYATALGVSSLFLWLRNGALLQLAIKAVKSDDDLSKYENFAKLFNLLSSTLLALMSFFYTGKFSFYIILAYSFSLFLSFPCFSNRVSYIEKDNYKGLSIYELAVGLTSSVTLIISAAIFKTELCFAISIVMVAIFESCFYINRKNTLASIFILSFKKVEGAWWKAKWLLLGAFGASLVMQGGFLVVGNFYDNETLGLYYFSFQLVAVVSIILGESIRKVVMPFLVRQKENSLNAYVQLIFVYSSILIPFSFGASLITGDVVLGLWGNKWENAVFSIEIYTFTLFISVLISLSYSFLEAEDKWKNKNLLQLLDGFLLIAFLICASFYDSVDAIASAVVVRRVLFGAFQIYYPVLVTGKQSLKVVFYFIVLVALNYFVIKLINNSLMLILSSFYSGLFSTIAAIISGVYLAYTMSKRKFIT